ncbi:hypothetical protein DXG03_003437, partial [Asterophora parasitica]
MASQTTSSSKRPRVEDYGDVTIEDLTILVLKMQVEFGKQCKRTEALETEVCRLTTLLATPPSPSVPAPTPIPTSSTIPIVTITEDDTMNEPSPLNSRPLDDPPPTSKPDQSPENPTDLERSIVIARLPVDKNLSPEQQVREDYDQVIALSSLVGYPVLPISVYRMPPRDVNATHPRLTK